MSSERPSWLGLVALVAAGCWRGPVDGGSSEEPAGAWWTLPAGSRYFERDGRRAPLVLRNATAPDPAAFSRSLRLARSAGAQVVRVQLTQGFGYDTLGIDARGAVLPEFAAAWDEVLDEAREQELAVIPVFSVWGDWNDGAPAAGWSHFDANPLNRARGGPAGSPADLFVSGSETQRAWLGWLGTLVERWAHHPHIVAWEVFSELDLATGADEASATAFAERASDVVRERDPLRRPVLASTSDLPLLGGRPWTTLWASRANDVVSLHPYAVDLDRAVVERVRWTLDATTKPVMVGESGLDAAAPDGSTLSTSPQGRVGLRQAVWAGAVSGSASARALYWEDGYAAYYPGSGAPFVESMEGLDRDVATWLRGSDYTRLAPARLSGPPTVFAVALASDSEVRGFVRSASLVAPRWTGEPVVDATLAVTLPAGSGPGTWTVALTTLEGVPAPPVAGRATDGTLTFTVPGPLGALAFVATIDVHGSP